MTKFKSVSEWDNPRNSPILTKKPGVGVREYPSAKATKEAANDPAAKGKQPQKFGRAKARKQKVAAILAKARKGG